MEYRRLGNSGLKISALSFGSWITFGNQVDLTNATKLLKTAYSAGVNFFDNAEAYAKGKVIGEAASCQYLDPSTNFIKIQLGQAIKVPLRMDDDFEGSFEVRAIDPKTQANFATLKLKTNYMDRADGCA